MKRIALCWPRFGPYHLARIDAVARQLGDQFSVIGIETDPNESTYAWETESRDGQGWRRYTITQAEHTKEVLSEIRPDVLFINGWGYADSRRLLAWSVKHHVPSVLFSDSRRDDAPRRIWTEWVKRRLVALSSSAIVAGPSHQRYMAELGMSWERIFLGLDVVDNDYFSKAASLVTRRLPIIEEQIGQTPYFLFVGRFVKKKNLLRLIEAFAIYHRQLGHQAWNLILIGDGEDKELITGEIDRLRLNEVVRIVPFQQYSSLPAVYRFAECLLLPSTSNEQWGLVVNEAMACGLPVLASSVCGCADSLVQDEVNGYQFNPLSKESIANVMLKFSLTSSENRSVMGQASKRIVGDWGLDRFSTAVADASDICLTSPVSRTFLNKQTIRMMDGAFEIQSKYWQLPKIRTGLL